MKAKTTTEGQLRKPVTWTILLLLAVSARAHAEENSLLSRMVLGVTAEPATEVNRCRRETAPRPVQAMKAVPANAAVPTNAAAPTNPAATTNTAAAKAVPANATAPTASALTAVGDSVPRSSPSIRLVEATSPMGALQAPSERPSRRKLRPLEIEFDVSLGERTESPDDGWGNDGPRRGANLAAFSEPTESAESTEPTESSESAAAPRRMVDEPPSTTKRLTRSLVEPIDQIDFRKAWAPYDKLEDDHAGRDTVISTYRDPYFGTGRTIDYHWTPRNLAHRTLYFDDLPLERWGQSRPPCKQAFCSTVEFVGDAVAVPFRWPRERHRLHYTLGWARPGSCAPQVKERFCPPK